MSVNDTLENREKIYADYEGGNQLRSLIMHSLLNRYYKIHEVPMMLSDQYHLYDIVNKLSRLAVTPRHIDSWHDIAGYAMLVETHLIKEKTNAVKPTTAKSETTGTNETREETSDKVPKPLGRDKSTVTASYAPDGTVEIYPKVGYSDVE